MKKTKKYIGLFLIFILVIAIFSVIVILIIKEEKKNQEELHRITGKTIQNILENEEQTEEENELEILSEKEYNIGQDTFHFSFGRNEEEYNLFAWCNVEKKENAFWTNFSLNSLLIIEDENVRKLIDGLNFSYIITVGDGTTITRTKDISLFMSSEGKMINSSDYFSTDWIVENADMDSDYGTKVLNFLVDFMENE